MVGVQWSVGMTLEGVEKEVILQAFRFYKGNKTLTAQALNVSISTIDNKLKKYKEDGASNAKREHDEREQARLWAHRERFGHDGRAAQPPRATEFDKRAAADEFGFGEGEAESEGAELNGDDPSAGVRVEPAPVSSSQPTVSVPVGPQVQGLPPRKASVGGTSGRR